MPGTETSTSTDVCDWSPDAALVARIADRITAEFGKHARGREIGDLAIAGGIPEADNLDFGQTEELFEEVRDELAARDNGCRR